MTRAAFVEANFDGLPGPTHNFAGLAAGNLASARSAGTRSWPRQAALQSLDKMRFMLGLGLVQGILPPHPRPAMGFLERIGFDTTTPTILPSLAATAPELLAAVYSSSAMWVANAATVSPAPDTADGRVHFTTANLSSQLHRCLEADHTTRMIADIFGDDGAFARHAALPGIFADEGAANHTRLAVDYAAPGVEFFVYGRRLFRPESVQPALPARQVREAAEAVARCHGLDPKRTVFARQLPAAVDAGVFHNDVICVGNRDLLLVHEQAFEEQQGVLARLDAAMQGALKIVEVPAQRIPLERAVSTYLFNAQLVSPGNDADSQVLIAPAECREDPAVHDYLEALLAAGTLTAVHYLDVRQSMKNGGGPACLRLRVAASREALSKVRGRVIADTSLLDELQAFVEARYPEYIDPADLADPDLARAATDALAGVYRILELPLPETTPRRRTH